MGVKFDKFFIDMDTNPLSDMSFASIFSHSIGCLLVLLIVSFAVQKLFIFNSTYAKKPTIIWSLNLQQSKKEYPMGKGQSLQQMVLGKLDTYMQKNETRPFPYKHLLQDYLQ